MTRLARDTLLRDTPGCRDPISGRSGGLAEGLLKRCALLQLLNLVWYVLNQLLELRQLHWDGLKQLLQLLMLDELQLLQLLQLLRKELQQLNDLLDGVRTGGILSWRSLSAEEWHSIRVELLRGMAEWRANS